MARPHIAAVLDERVSRLVETLLRRRGWRERVVAYTGYGDPDEVRLFARVVLGRPGEPDTHEGVLHTHDADHEPVTRRGWRNFVTAPVVRAPVTVRVGEATHQAVTDRGGYLDVSLAGHGLAPGWHRARVQAGSGGDRDTAADAGSVPGDGADADVLVIDPQVRHGVVSDIDDTVMVTHLPRPFIAAWNTFIRSETAREPVRGMAALYSSLLADRPGTPIFYLSTGAWNTAHTLTRFLRRHRFPVGPLLLTDWGPSNTGWFRSGQEHKRAALRALAEQFPQIRWVLVGDDGQHDPQLYGEFAAEHTAGVEVVAIRELTPTQQVLSHGIPLSTEEWRGRLPSAVPTVRAADGFGLNTLIRRVRRARQESLPTA